MNYFNYAIKCVIRRIIYMLTKPKYLIIILTSIVVIFLLSQYTTVFGYTGNDDYTDKNNTIMITYESVITDFINRYKNVPKNNVNIDLLNSLLNNDSMSFYVYYGNIDGSSMTSSNYFNTEDLHIIFYSKGNPSPSVSTQERYFGMFTPMYNLTTSIEDYFYFTNGILYTSNKPSSVVIPGVLISYYSSSWYEFKNNDSSEQTNSIVGAINEQTNTINEQTQVIQDTQDFLTNDNIESSTMNINTDNMTVQDSNNIFGFLQSFLVNLRDFYNNISDDVQVIEIPMPHNMDSIYLRSDIISSHIQGTFLYTFIQTLWYFVFGTYLLFYIKHLINFFSTGEFAYTGLALFLEHLENEDVIIRSTMM